MTYFKHFYDEVILALNFNFSFFSGWFCNNCIGRNF